MNVQEIGEKMVEEIKSVEENNISQLLLRLEDSSSIAQFDTEKRKITRYFVGHTGKINEISMNHSQKLFSTSSQDNTCKIWDVNSFRPSFTLEGHFGYVTSSLLVETSSSTCCFTASTDNCIKVWDIKKLKTPLYELGFFFLFFFIFCFFF